MKPAKMSRTMGAHHASKSSVPLECRRQVSSAGCKEGSEGGTGQIRQPWEGAAGGMTHDAEEREKHCISSSHLKLVSPTSDATVCEEWAGLAASVV